MKLLTQQILAGISTGAIYACMALAVVMIGLSWLADRRRATRVRDTELCERPGESASTTTPLPVPKLIAALEEVEERMKVVDAHVRLTRRSRVRAGKTKALFAIEIVSPMRHREKSTEETRRYVEVFRTPGFLDAMNPPN